MIITASYSFTSTAYEEDELFKILGLVEANVGVGLMLGPVVGNFIYAGIGFKATFIIIGASMAPFTILIIFFLQKPLKVRELRAKMKRDNLVTAINDEDREDEEMIEEREEPDAEESVAQLRVLSYTDLLGK